MSLFSSIRSAIERMNNATTVGTEKSWEKLGKTTVLDARGGDDKIHIHTNFDGSVEVDVNGESYSFSAAEARNLVIRGGNGNDRITTSGWSNGATPNITIEGGNGDDVIQGTIGNDRIDGGRGNDVIRGGDGDDLINGGLGNDWIRGEKGNDQITGGGGNDYANGGPGCDTVRDASPFPIIHLSASQFQSVNGQHASERLASDGPFFSERT